MRVCEWREEGVTRFPLAWAVTRRSSCRRGSHVASPDCAAPGRGQEARGGGRGAGRGGGGPNRRHLPPLSGPSLPPLPPARRGARSVLHRQGAGAAARLRGPIGRDGEAREEAGQRAGFLRATRGGEGKPEELGRKRSSEQAEAAAAPVGLRQH